MQDLFSPLTPALPDREVLAEGAVLLRGAALETQTDLLQSLALITAQAPFRHMVTPGGFTMSVAMSNCGPLGWISDRSGYRYSPVDPQTNLKWPEMPDCFMQLAQETAAKAGYPDFTPDACLINRYEPKTKLSLHQDKDEKSPHHPIVSVSLGLQATFQFGGLKRSDTVHKYALQHGDVVVWGGPSRLNYHGIPTLKDGQHPLLGCYRINLTFRKAA
ncbi:DNA oxidative demethylase AlkB [Pseudochrobactrum sp. MP213Fo]|uniref:DNA oxidative demethylase AlkB n=1 Tax=Pseudochrobactrum sp. MP213Fo TaxID=3022250 RepID=UPI003BA0E86F